MVPALSGAVRRNRRRAGGVREMADLARPRLLLPAASPNPRRRLPSARACSTGSRVRGRNGGWAAAGRRRCWQLPAAVAARPAVWPRRGPRVARGHDMAAHLPVDVGRRAGRRAWRCPKSSTWSLVMWALVPAIIGLALVALARSAACHGPSVRASRSFTRRWCPAAPLGGALVWTAWAITQDGDPAPLPYLPLLNPLEIVQAASLVGHGIWARAGCDQARDSRRCTTLALGPADRRVRRPPTPWSAASCTSTRACRSTSIASPTPRHSSPACRCCGA